MEEVIYQSAVSDLSLANHNVSDNGSARTDGSVSETSILSVFLGALYVLIIIVSFVGNGMVIIAVISTHKLKTITNYLLMSLAVADLTVTVSLPHFPPLTPPPTPSLQTERIFLFAENALFREISTTSSSPINKVPSKHPPSI
jgi:hypothetical protein